MSETFGVGVDPLSAESSGLSSDPLAPKDPGQQPPPEGMSTAPVPSLAQRPTKPEPKINLPLSDVPSEMFLNNPYSWAFTDPEQASFGVLKADENAGQDGKAAPGAITREAVLQQLMEEVGPEGKLNSISTWLSGALKHFEEERKKKSNQPPDPTAPEYEQVPQKPYVAREFDKKAFGVFATIMLGVAAILGKNSMGGTLTALNAYGSALNGYMKGEKEAADRHREDFLASTRGLLQQNQMRLNKYKMAMEQYKNDPKNLNLSLEAIGIEHQDKVMVEAAKTKGLEEALKVFTAEDRMQMQAIIAAGKNDAMLMLGAIRAEAQKVLDAQKAGRGTPSSQAKQKDIDSAVTTLERMQQDGTLAKQLQLQKSRPELAKSLDKLLGLASLSKDPDKAAWAASLQSQLKPGESHFLGASEPPSVPAAPGGVAPSRGGTVRVQPPASLSGVSGLQHNSDTGEFRDPATGEVYDRNGKYLRKEDF
jgi:hypothetical protein